MAPDNDHVTIKITKGSGPKGGTCDKLQIVYGSVDYTQLQLKANDTIYKYKLHMNVKKQLR